MLFLPVVLLAPTSPFGGGPLGQTRVVTTSFRWVSLFHHVLVKSQAMPPPPQHHGHGGEPSIFQKSASRIILS